ncbi:transcription termination factor 5, mitochondrial-like [Centruroides vittatus]|uniref:transcription termination factor 5, mitochondrial-like n=1 Tax=Centruroides vittatus TaxID=120091 RepID=UPI0035108DC5
MNYIVYNKNLIRRIYCFSYCIRRYMLSVRTSPCDKCGYPTCKCNVIGNSQLPSCLVEESQKSVMCSSKLSELFGGSPEFTVKLIANNTKILDTDPNKIKKNLIFLRQYFEDSDIAENSSLLHWKLSLIEEKIRILEEVGIMKITIDSIIKYSYIMKQKMKYLKEERLIHRSSRDEIIKNMVNELSAPEELFHSIRKKLSLKKINITPAKDIRAIVLKAYLTQRLNCNENDIEKICTKYSTIFPKSCFVIKSTLDILLNQFYFQTSKIISNGFLITLNPENLKSILENVQSLAGWNIMKCARKAPRILCLTPEKLLETDKYLKENNFTNRQLQNGLSIYSLNIDTIKERLKTIDKEVELNMRKFAPKILTVVHSHDLLLSRLRQLQQRGFPSISLGMLFQSPEKLELDIKYNCSVETCQYLSVLLDKSENEIKQKLCEYPNVIWTSLQNVKKVTKYLMSNGITKEQIWNGIHIVFYSIDIIEKHFEKLPYYNELQPFSYWKSQNNLLHLLLYYIEKESGFTVDNINIGKSEKMMLRHFTDHCT